tara:strand:- start:24 stop:371 length:348 start_codon:yes stop_codon:yes gene_type:complete
MNWKWHITMATSILHRATGIALYVGAFALVGWLLAIASGPEAYAGYSAVMGSPLGLLILFGFTVAIFYHLANGIRHLFWDAGTGYKPETATMTAWVTIIVGIVGAVALWAIILAA